MPFEDLPPAAAWQHRVAREGTECAFFDAGLITGWTVAVEERRRWVVRYEIDVDTATGATRGARVANRTDEGAHEVVLETDGDGHWTVDGVVRRELDGCRDVDLESSVMTNMLVIRRLQLDVGERADAPAAYVRALDLRVERLEQSYRRQADDGRADGGPVFDYAAPVFDVEVDLRYDRAGLVLDYPGIAVRL